MWTVHRNERICCGRGRCWNWIDSVPLRRPHRPFVGRIVANLVDAPESTSLCATSHLGLDRWGHCGHPVVLGLQVCPCSQRNNISFGQGCGFGVVDCRSVCLPCGVSLAPSIFNLLVPVLVHIQCGNSRWSGLVTWHMEVCDLTYGSM